TGEDLGAGYGTASAVLAGWQASAAHNAVLLNPYYDALGIGLVYEPNSTYKWYWAADFGGPGGTVKVIVPPAARPELVAARAGTARIAFIEGLGARRIAHLFAVLMRMGAI
ncbi:MAG TPA: CAP domain-containing protein, partial [Candidatus Limnocylindria bacterium]